MDFTSFIFDELLCNSCWCKNLIKDDGWVKRPPSKTLRLTKYFDCWQLVHCLGLTWRMTYDCCDLFFLLLLFFVVITVWWCYWTVQKRLCQQEQFKFEFVKWSLRRCCCRSARYWLCLVVMSKWSVIMLIWCSCCAQVCPQCANYVSVYLSAFECLSSPVTQQPQPRCALTIEIEHRAFCSCCG